MKTKEIPWDKAPTEATHFNTGLKAFYKFELNSVQVCNPDTGNWLDSAYTTRDIVSSLFKSRPRKSLLNGLTWWRK